MDYDDVVAFLFPFNAGALGVSKKKKKKLWEAGHGGRGRSRGLVIDLHV